MLKHVVHAHTTKVHANCFISLEVWEYALGSGKVNIDYTHIPVKSLSPQQQQTRKQASNMSDVIPQSKTICAIRSCPSLKIQFLAKINILVISQMCLCLYVSKLNVGISFFHTLEGTTRYSDQLLVPAQCFDLWLRLCMQFCPFLGHFCVPCYLRSKIQNTLTINNIFKNPRNLKQSEEKKGFLFSLAF